MIGLYAMLILGGSVVVAAGAALLARLLREGFGSAPPYIDMHDPLELLAREAARPPDETRG